MSDPLLSLISTGLKLWVRSRCDSVGSLELSLQGSSLGLLRGHLQGARLEAREVRFQGLPLQHAVLSSGPIQVDLQLLQPCLLYTSPSPRDDELSRMPSSA